MLRVHNFTISLDGYGAGPAQSQDDPLGVGGEQLHDWAFATRTFRAVHGLDGGSEGLDDQWAARAESGIGASIMGRNMFAPHRGPWADDSWTGWWGDEPPFHHPVFVLTHHPRPSVELKGTTFHFVSDGIEAARERALDAANGLDVQVAGGVSTIRQYLAAGLIDQLDLAIAPVLLGDGERLLGGFGTPIGYRVAEFAASEAVLHVRLLRLTD